MANQQHKSTQKTKIEIVIDSCDATGLSVEVLKQSQALFHSIMKQSENNSDIKELAGIGAMLVDFSVDTLEDYYTQFKTIHQGASA